MLLKMEASTLSSSLCFPLLPSTRVFISFSPSSTNSISTTRKIESKRRRTIRVTRRNSSSPCMSEPSSLLHPYKLPSSKMKASSPKAPQASLKSLFNLLYKLAFFLVFIALLPLSPSQVPKFAGETISTGIWELLHLLLVGIAISYGLFGRRNVDPDAERELPQKADGTQTFVSQMLQVPSVFDDDEVDGQLEGLNESKAQTWRSQYYRNEPVAVAGNGVENANHAINERVLLPIRSLKSYRHDFEFSDDGDGYFSSVNGSRQSVDSRNGSKESTVLPSPIPWRSRLEKLERKDKAGPGTGIALSRSYSLPPELDASKGLPKSTHASSSAVPAPKRLSRSPSLSTEIRAKSSEDTVKKKNSYKPAPPPAPPADLGRRYPSTSERTVTARSFKDELRDMSRKEREGWHSNNDKVVDPLVSAATKPRNSFECPVERSSVRTVRAKEVQSSATTKTCFEHSISFQSRQPPPVPKHPAERRNEFVDKAVISSDDSDSDEAVEPSCKDVSNSSAPEAGADDSEVDKKADEFIAKFREQIRLQRIESIKRSTRQCSNRKPQ